MTTKHEKKELRVVWLDLANAYGSVPHNGIRFVLKFFHIHEKVFDILMQYFGDAFRLFSTNNYTMCWLALDVGIMVGCVVSPLLFVMCMELILRGQILRIKTWGVMSPSGVFMDWPHFPVQSWNTRTSGPPNDLLTRAWMKAKLKESRSNTFVLGTICDIHFSMGGNTIPTAREQQVKCLGWLYAFQANQCAWINWEGDEVRKLSRSSRMTMKPLALSFLPHSTYNLLPTPANHKQWDVTGDDICAMNETARGTLGHILSSHRSSI